MNDTSSSIQHATLGNGCFWCTEAVFAKLQGVISVTSGYSGGAVDNPTYKEVCAGNTGHAECLDIEYDSNVINFEDLLQVFFATHDPTTLNRQGNDVGTQYRSVIFYRNETEKEIAANYIVELNQKGVWSNTIVTTLESFVKFYPAEDYHHNYFSLHGYEPYCQFVVRPKVEKFEKLFKARLKK